MPKIDVVGRLQIVRNLAERRHGQSAEIQRTMNRVPFVQINSNRVVFFVRKRRFGIVTPDQEWSFCETPEQAAEIASGIRRA